MKKKKIYICPECEEIKAETYPLTDGWSMHQGTTGGTTDEGDQIGGGSARPDLLFGEEDLESDY